MVNIASAQPTLELIWRKYKRWAETSRRRKRELQIWQCWAMILTIVGAVLEMVSAQMPVWGLNNEFWSFTGQIVAFIGGGALVVSTAIRAKKLSSSQHNAWLKARALAEAFKSAYYRYRAGIPLLNGDIPERHGLRSLSAQLDANVDIMPSNNLKASEEIKGFDPRPLDIDEYIKVRVQEQINQFYRPQARFHRQEAKRLRNCEFVLGICAAFLGLSGAIFNLANITTAWVAIITNCAAIFTIQLTAERHDFLVISYSATAARLEILLERLQEARRTGKSRDDQIRILEECEMTISNENKAWGVVLRADL